ncbi:MAG TPA: hypothetical protein VNA13_00630 [Xanthomonadales bacterium]|nr:hypothetical protein [Xanthomonadales bacterium]
MDDNIRQILKEKLHGAHDYSHIERILKYGQKINAVHKGNWKIIEAALLLHEITKNDLSSIKEYLSDFTDEEIAEVTYCIARHYDFVDKPTSLEGKIVQDCDILDMLGAVGIARGFVASGEKGLNLVEAKDEYKKKRLMVIDQLNLDESKKMAEDKSKFTILFFDTIEGEI